MVPRLEKSASMSLELERARTQVSLSFIELDSTRFAEEKLDPAQAELRDLTTGLKSVRDEQEYLLDREIIHKKSTIICYGSFNSCL